MLNSILPLASFNTNLVSSFSISSSSRNSNTLSDAAPDDWRLVSDCAIDVSGWLNNLTYIINATITPNVILSL